MESTASGPREIVQSSESKAAPIAQEHVDLRDYFAASALQAIVTSGGTGEIERDTEGAYHYADAMLRAREASDAS